MLVVVFFYFIAVWHKCSCSLSNAYCFFYYTFRCFSVSVFRFHFIFPLTFIDNFWLCLSCHCYLFISILWNVHDSTAPVCGSGIETAVNINVSNMGRKKPKTKAIKYVRMYVYESRAQIAFQCMMMPTMRNGSMKPFDFRHTCEHLHRFQFFDW